MLLENESCVNIKSFSIWGFEFWNWGFWLFDEYWPKVLICKGFWCYLCIQIDRIGFKFVLGWFGSHERQFYRISKFFKIHVDWLVSRLMTSFVSNDPFCIQWLVLNSVTNFEFSNQFRVQWLVSSLATNFEFDDQY